MNFRPLVILAKRGGETVAVFFCGTRIVTGAGGTSELGQLGAKRVFLACREEETQGGLAQQVLSACGARETEAFRLRAPTLNLAAEGAAAIRRYRPDLILVMGDGQAIQCGKAMTWFSGSAAPLAAIPTTADLGAEVTDQAALTHGTAMHFLRESGLRPGWAVLDPGMLLPQTARKVAEGGFAVLCHGAEAYVARNAGPFTDLLAGEAFSATFAKLPAAAAGLQGMRQAVGVCAAMAALAHSQAGLGLCGAMARTLEQTYGAPYGALCGILLPTVIGCNAYAAGEKYGKLARLAGLSPGAGSLQNGLVRLRRELAMAGTLAQLGIDPRQVWLDSEKLVQKILLDPACAGNPIQVEDFMIRRVLEAVTGHI